LKTRAPQKRTCKSDLFSKVKFLRFNGIATLLFFTFTSILGDYSAYAQTIQFRAGSELRGLDNRAESMAQLPIELGEVKDFSFSGSPDRPFVFHIQDAHANPEAQRQIKRILDWVSERANENREIPSVALAVEGTADVLAPEYADFFPEYPEVNAAIAQKLIDQGELNGAEYFFIEERLKRGKDSKFFSVASEDAGIYKSNLALYRNLLLKQDEINLSLSSVRSKIELAQSRIFSPALREFITERTRRKHGDYESGVVAPQLVSYLNYLEKSAAKLLGIKLTDRFEQVRFPQIVRALVLRDLESSLKPDQAESQKSEILAALNKIARTPELKALEDRVKNLGASGDVRGTLESLWKAQSQGGLDFGRHGEFWKLAGSWVLRSEMNAEGLYDEMELLEGWIISKLTVNANEEKLVRTLNHFELIEKLLALKWTTREYEKFETGREEVFAALFENGLDDLLAAAGHKSEAAQTDAQEIVKSHVNAALEFYVQARTRDQILLDKALANLPSASIAVLVSGGFHSEGITRLLKEKGMRYAVVQPRFRTHDNGALYHAVMKGDAYILSNYFPVPLLTMQEAAFFKAIVETGGALLWEKAGVPHAEIGKTVAAAISRHPLLGSKIEVKYSAEGRGSKVLIAAKEFTAESLSSTDSNTVAIPSIMQRREGFDRVLGTDGVWQDSRGNLVYGKEAIGKGVPVVVAFAPVGTQITVRSSNDFAALAAQGQTPEIDPAAVPEFRAELRSIPVGTQWQIVKKYKLGYLGIVRQAAAIVRELLAAGIPTTGLLATDVPLLTEKAASSQEFHEYLTVIQTGYANTLRVLENNPEIVTELLRRAKTPAEFQIFLDQVREKINTVFIAPVKAAGFSTKAGLQFGIPELAKRETFTLDQFLADLNAYKNQYIIFQQRLDAENQRANATVYDPQGQAAAQLARISVIENSNYSITITPQQKFELARLAGSTAPSLTASASTQEIAYKGYRLLVPADATTVKSDNTELTVRRAGMDLTIKRVDLQGIVYFVMGNSTYQVPVPEGDQLDLSALNPLGNQAWFEFYGKTPEDVKDQFSFRLPVDNAAEGESLRLFPVNAGLYPVLTAPQVSPADLDQYRRDLASLFNEGDDAVRLSHIGRILQALAVAGSQGSPWDYYDAQAALNRLIDNSAYDVYKPLLVKLSDHLLFSYVGSDWEKWRGIKSSIVNRSDAAAQAPSRTKSVFERTPEQVRLNVPADELANWYVANVDAVSEGSTALSQLAETPGNTVYDTGMAAINAAKVSSLVFAGGSATTVKKTVGRNKLVHPALFVRTNLSAEPEWISLLEARIALIQGQNENSRIDIVSSVGGTRQGESDLDILEIVSRVYGENAAKGLVNVVKQRSGLVLDTKTGEPLRFGDGHVATVAENHLWAFLSLLLNQGRVVNLVQDTEGVVIAGNADNILNYPRAGMVGEILEARNRGEAVATVAVTTPSAGDRKGGFAASVTYRNRITGEERTQVEMREVSEFLTRKGSGFKGIEITKEEAPELYSQAETNGWFVEDIFADKKVAFNVAFYGVDLKLIAARVFGLDETLTGEALSRQLAAANAQQWIQTILDLVSKVPFTEQPQKSVPDEEGRNPVKGYMTEQAVQDFIVNALALLESKHGRPAAKVSIVAADRNNLFLPYKGTDQNVLDRAGNERKDIPATYDLIANMERYGGVVEELSAKGHQVKLGGGKVITEVLPVTLEQVITASHAEQAEAGVLFPASRSELRSPEEVRDSIQTAMRTARRVVVIDETEIETGYPYLLNFFNSGRGGVVALRYPTAGLSGVAGEMVLDKHAKALGVTMDQVTAKIDLLAQPARSRTLSELAAKGFIDTTEWPQEDHDALKAWIKAEISPSLGEGLISRITDFEARRFATLKTLGIGLKVQFTHDGTDYYYYPNAHPTDARTDGKDSIILGGQSPIILKDRLQGIGTKTQKLWDMIIGGVPGQLDAADAVIIVSSNPSGLQTSFADVLAGKNVIQVNPAKLEIQAVLNDPETWRVETAAESRSELRTAVDEDQRLHEGVGELTPDWLRLNIIGEVILERVVSQPGPFSIGDISEEVNELMEAEGLDRIDDLGGLVDRLVRARLLRPSNGGFELAVRRDVFAVKLNVVEYIRKDFESALTRLAAAANESDRDDAGARLGHVVVDYAQTVRRWPLYPVESKWPVLTAVGLLSAEHQKTLVDFLNGSNLKWQGLVDSILHMLDPNVPEDWLLEHAPNLAGRSVYYISPETWLAAGGLGRVGQYHSVWARLLMGKHSNLKTIEPYYPFKLVEEEVKDSATGQIRKVTKEVPIDYSQVTVPVSDLTEQPVMEFEVPVRGKSIKAQVFKGVNEYGVEVYLVKDSGNYYTRLLYKYGKDFASAEWYEFTEFFNRAALELTTRLEAGEKELKKDKYKAPVLWANDGQSGLLPILKRIQDDDKPDNALKNAVTWMTTHTYRNRGIYNLVDGRLILQQMGINQKYWHYFERLDNVDFTSAGVRAADGANGVAAVHRDEVYDIDPSVRLLGITNGDHREASAKYFREILADLYPGADPERPTPEQVFHVKRRAKELVGLNPDQPVIAYTGRLVDEKIGIDSAFTYENLEKLVQSGAQVVLYANVQSHTGWMLDRLREWEARINALPPVPGSSRPKGKLIIKSGWDITDQRKLLPAIDGLSFPSTRKTEAAGYTEADGLATAAIIFGPAFREGVLQPSSIINRKVPGRGSSLIAKSATPEGWRVPFLWLIEQFYEDLAGFSAKGDKAAFKLQHYQASAVPSSRKVEARITSAAYLSSFSHAIGRKEHPFTTLESYIGGERLGRYFINEWLRNDLIRYLRLIFAPQIGKSSNANVEGYFLQDIKGKPGVVVINKGPYFTADKREPANLRDDRRGEENVFHRIAESMGLNPEKDWISVVDAVTRVKYGSYPIRHLEENGLFVQASPDTHLQILHFEAAAGTPTVEFEPSNEEVNRANTFYSETIPPGVQTELLGLLPEGLIAAAGTTPKDIVIFSPAEGFIPAGKAPAWGTEGNYLLVTKGDGQLTLTFTKTLSGIFNQGVTESGNLAFIRLEVDEDKLWIRLGKLSSFPEAKSDAYRKFANPAFHYWFINHLLPFAGKQGFKTVRVEQIKMTDKSFTDLGFRKISAAEPNQYAVWEYDLARFQGRSELRLAQSPVSGAPAPGAPDTEEPLRRLTTLLTPPVLSDDDDVSTGTTIVNVRASGILETDTTVRLAEEAGRVAEAATGFILSTPEALVANGTAPDRYVAAVIVLKRLLPPEEGDAVKWQQTEAAAMTELGDAIGQLFRQSNEHAMELVQRLSLQDLQNEETQFLIGFVLAAAKERTMKIFVVPGEEGPVSNDELRAVREAIQDKIRKFGKSANHASPDRLGFYPLESPADAAFSRGVMQETGGKLANVPKALLDKSGEFLADVTATRQLLRVDEGTALNRAQAGFMAAVSLQFQPDDTYYVINLPQYLAQRGIQTQGAAERITKMIQALQKIAVAA